LSAAASSARVPRSRNGFTPAPYDGSALGWSRNSYG
jgi:hypothetical protein